MKSTDGLKFLLTLLDCPKQRSPLNAKLFGKDKDKLCQTLGNDGLVDFSREIVSVKISASGQELLENAANQLPISTVELKLLQALATVGKVSPTTVKVASLKAGDRTKLLQDFRDRGLVTVAPETSKLTRKTITVQLAPPGRALLEMALEQMPLPIPEMDLLQQIEAAKRVAPGKLKMPTGKTAEREPLLRSFLEKGWLEAETRLKKTRAEVWLTDRGRACLEQVSAYFESVRFSPGEVTKAPAPTAVFPTVESPAAKPSDEEILQTIRDLDRQLGTRNDLPIFHLRQKLQPPLSREELDQILYRFQRQDQIELSTLVHAQNYTPEQVNAGIEQRSGSPLFFIKVMVE